MEDMSSVVRSLTNEVEHLQKLYDWQVAENQRLREALREIADSVIPGVIGDGYSQIMWVANHYVMLTNKAHNALKETE